MKYIYSYSDDWHIMIPVRDNRGYGYFVIASCTDKSIIEEIVPAGLTRHVKSLKYGQGIKLDNPEIELKYSLICSKCIDLHNKEEIKFQLIVNKLKGEK